ncbi:uncharacterized protein CDAR_258751 [Caerostris darwini]|uniref:Uncharacterized protein n=1 Tax=Caerostris darwini TaxID=1538125 RepID=A0AAV4U850_9ARAC|nr:uncharacterized protein CDAR_258751 [Caerostris darwini]
MNPPSLYDLSLRQTVEILRVGIWRRFEENPLELIPKSVYDDLVKLTFSLPIYARPRAHDIFFLLSSGQPKQLDLYKFNTRTNFVPRFKEIFDDEYLANLNAEEKHFQRVGLVDCMSLIRMMIGRMWPSVRSLSTPIHLQYNEAASRILIDRCPNLEDLHTEVLFSADFLKTCRNLRSLRFHLNSEQVLEHYKNNIVGIGSLRDLEVFSMCLSSANCFEIFPVVAHLLFRCPKLTSVGLLDTSLAIMQLLNCAPNPPARFALRSCFWGICHRFHVEDAKEEYPAIYKTRFPELIETSVAMCPLVEKLVMEVVHIDSLKFLPYLNNLTFLNLNFKFCDSLCVPEIITLLSKVGHKLKYLLIEKPLEDFRLKFPVNVICKHCDNLETFGVFGYSVVKGKLVDYPSLKKLKKLSILNSDEDSLYYMLKNCVNLEELSLFFAFYLDDYLLGKILASNSLSKLKLLQIYQCNLSRTGVEALIRSAVNLEKISFNSMDGLASSVVKDLNRDIKYFDATVEYFPCMVDACHF